MDMEIFATLGPGCGDEKTLYEMMSTGMTGIRLNLSHAGLPESRPLLEGFYAAQKKYGCPVDLLIDLQGPELRIGRLDQPLILKENDSAKIPVSEKVASLLEAGQTVLLDDGKLRGTVTEVGVDHTIINIIRGGTLNSSKSIKIEGLETSLPTLTEEDKATLSIAKEYGVTSVMLPFVRGASDVEALREVIGNSFRIFAKIENLTGVDHLNEIIRSLNPETDMLVIARGDLGNAMPLWELPKIQKQIEAACHEMNMPYLVVTELLASMVKSPVPTRAEVSDVYHAIYHGASALMVTNETAVGVYPVEVIKYLKNISEHF